MRRPTVSARAIAIAVLSAAPAGAFACTLCRSPAARLVRDRVFDAGFAATLAEVALPLLVMGVALALSARRRPR